MDAIVAVYADWGIGAKGTQPRVIPGDRRRFRELTMDAAVIVGRRTLEDFPGGKPLPGRENFVLSRRNITIEGAQVVHDPDEAVAAAAPQVIIDTGEAKNGAKEDLDALQEQLGIPVIFIEAKLSDYGAAYERLGELLGMEERGSELSTYCTDVYNKTVTTMENIPENERVRMAYLLGDNGLNAIAKTSFQAAVVDMVADNVVVVDDVSGKGNGNEISLEQIALWNPDLIVFQTGSIYDTVGDDPAWAGIAAIDSGNYYQVPNVPYCWLNNPPTVNQLMGLQWLPRLLYPDAFDDSIEDATRAYYSTMYNYDLSDTELADLIKDAVPKA